MPPETEDQEQQQAGANKPEQGTLQRSFQREAGMFKIDLGAFEGNPSEMTLSEIRSDPSLSEHLAGRPYIYTDDINSQIFTPELRAQIDRLTDTHGRSLDVNYVANKQALQGTLIAAGEQFMTNLRETAPELHALIQTKIEQSIPKNPVAVASGNITGSLDTNEFVAIERIRYANEFLHNYFVDTLYRPPTPPEHGDQNTPDAKTSATPQAETKIVYAFLPGSNFSFSADVIRHPSLAEAKTPPPGSNTEWAALATDHETEHYIDALKDRDPKIIPPEMRVIMQTSPEIQRAFGAVEHALANAREIESDMSSIAALDGKIDPAIPPYWAALRMGDSMLATLPRTVETEMPHADNVIMVPPFGLSSHDTGYFLSEYMETGNIPDYLQLMPTVQSFYQKTAQQYIETAREPLQKAGLPLEKLKEMSPLTLSDTVDLVQRTLAHDPSVYTPAEAQIAQTFVQNMNEQLGIERGNIDRAIKSGIESLPAEPAIQPEPGAGAEVKPAALGNRN